MDRVAEAVIGDSGADKAEAPRLVVADQGIAGADREQREVDAAIAQRVERAGRGRRGNDAQLALGGDGVQNSCCFEPSIAATRAPRRLSRVTA